MNLISNIDFMDFYFNGHYLSEFGGFVGGIEKLGQYSLLPARNYVTDRSISQDGLTVFDSYLDPRTFEVPVFFENIDTAGIRKIAGWLNSKNEQWFYFKDDTLKIKCTLDTNGTLLESLTGDDGSVSLKFIAHDPYYYEINNTISDYQNIVVDTNQYSFTNSGNTESFPKFSIWGDGTVKIDIYTKNKVSLYKTCTITGLTSGVVLDTRYRTCLTQSGAQLFNNFTGEFPVLPIGDYVVVVTGNVIHVNIEHNYRFI